MINVQGLVIQNNDNDAKQTIYPTNLSEDII